MQGRCSKGANCRFRHSVEDSPGGPPSVGGRGVPAAVEAITDIGCVYSIDVECVATGVQHHDRATAQIALVDSNATVIVNIFVKPTMPVVRCCILSNLVCILMLHFAVFSKQQMFPRLPGCHSK